jgi:hypothetical protein
MGELVSLTRQSDSVAIIEALLTAAKRGEIEGCAVVAIKSRYGLEVSASGDLNAEQQNRLIAGVARLYYSLLSES